LAHSLTPETVSSLPSVRRVSSLQFVLPSDPGGIVKVQEAVEAALVFHQFCRRSILAVRLALEEALVNAIKHGNRMDRSRKVWAYCRIDPEQFEIVITDEGQGFDPALVPDPTALENLEHSCGRGLYLMRHYMDEVVIVPPGNTVRMTKRRDWAA
jgi:serine/threonine-protein kinase RsbW